MWDTRKAETKMDLTMHKWVRIVSKYVSLGSIKQLLLNPWLIFRLPHYTRQLFAYRTMESKLGGGENTPLRIYPCLDDAQENQPVGYYFYQDCWAARQVFRENPTYVVDVGSSILLVGILSQFTHCISVDIRPILAHLDGLTAVSASVLHLPFKDNEVPCLTTMCVLEHIGLGRYGDPLNPKGTVDAAAEIARVIGPNGIVVYSVPVGHEMTEFNSNRRFRYEQAAHLFKGWELVDSCVLTPSISRFVPEEMPSRLRDPVACFCLRKPARSN